jgi:hypothetical protein
MDGSKAISCSFIKKTDETKCLSICEKEAYQHEIDCVTNTACASVLSTCGTPRGFDGSSSDGSAGGGEGGGAD